MGDDDRRGSALHEVPFHAVARLLRPPASTILTVVSVRLRCPWGLGTFDERDQRRMRIRERSVDRRPGRRTAATQRHRQGPTALATTPMRARPLQDQSMSSRVSIRTQFHCRLDQGRRCHCRRQSQGPKHRPDRYRYRQHSRRHWRPGRRHPSN